MSGGVGLSLGPSPGGAHQHNGNRAPTHTPTPKGGSVGSELHRGHTEASPLLCRGSCRHGGHAVQSQEVCWRRGAKIYNRHCCFLSTLCSWRPPLLRPQSPIHPPAHSHTVTHYCRFSLCFCVASSSLSPEDPPHIPTGRLDLGLGCHILTPKTKGLKAGCGLVCDTRRGSAVLVSLALVLEDRK